MRSSHATPRLALLTTTAALLVAASPTATGRVASLHAAFGDLEVPVTAIGRVPTGPTRGPVVLTLTVPELPLDHLTRRREPITHSGTAGAAAGIAVATTTPDAAATPDRVARLAVEVVRRFQPLDRFGMWLAIDENTITDELGCARPQIFGAQGAGRVVVQVHCTAITVTNPRSGSLFRRWATDTAGVPPAPARLEFTPGGTTLSSAAIEELRRLLALLAKHQDLSVLIAGFAEAGEGDPELVSARRAALIRDYLVTNGAARSRVTAVSYGSEKPLEGDDVNQAWSHNRRAHLTIVTGAVN